MKEITEEQTTHNMLMELIKEECQIDTSEIMEYPPTALSLGEKTIKTTLVLCKLLLRLKKPSLYLY